MKIYEVDIDGTICETNGTDYEHSIPNHDVIAKVNRSYADGIYIRIATARGSLSGIDWRQLTEEQLKKWGVKYHELIMKRPYADKIINDRAELPEIWVLR